MPEPLSATTLTICLVGYAALAPYAQASSAVSSEARLVQEAATAVVQSAERSEALFGPKAEAIFRLHALARECAFEGWDGDGGCPIQPLALRRAESFLRALPDAIPIPDFAPEPDGCLSLDWIQSRTRLFTLSVGPTHRLAYAWLDGTDKGHGVASFGGGAVPRRILDGISAILPQNDAPLGFA